MTWLRSLVLSLFILAGISSWPAVAAPFDWRYELKYIEQQLSIPGNLTAMNCALIVSSWTERLASMSSGDLIPRDAAMKAALLTKGDLWLEKFFHIRMLLKRRWDLFTAPSATCLASARRAFSYTRFAEDYIAEWLAAHGGLSDRPKVLLEEGAPHMLVNHGVNPFEIRAGDVLLMRGPDFISGLIARSGDEPGDFSHLAMVARDETGNKFVVEALAQSGTIISPLDAYLSRADEWRVAVLRYRDGATADRAAFEIYRKARGALDAGGPIPFNFRMDMSDETQLFCTQVARYAFRIASNGSVQVPQYLTRLTRFRETAIARAWSFRSTRRSFPRTYNSTHASTSSPNSGTLRI